MTLLSATPGQRPSKVSFDGQKEEASYVGKLGKAALQQICSSCRVASLVISQEMIRGATSLGSGLGMVMVQTANLSVNRNE